MSKWLMISGWTLFVALASYSYGRWGASPNWVSDYSVGGSTRLAADHAELVVTDKMERKVAVIAAPKSGASEVKTKPTTGSSYASDYDQMQLLIALAATNPQLAMEKAQRFKGAIRLQAQTAILAVWGGFDPSAAWNWLAANQPQNSTGFIGLLEVVGRSEPHQATLFAEQYAAEHRELRKDIYHALLTGITQAGAYDMAMDIVARLEIEASTKAEFNHLVVSAWANYAPQAAMQWLVAQPEDVQAITMPALSESWSTTDPVGAVHFAAEHPSGATQELLLLPGFKKWLELDAPAATSWLAAAPSNANIDSLIGELASLPSTTAGQVQEALRWAGKIQNTELRLNTVTGILSAFKQRDSATAAKYLREASYLTDAERVQLAENLVL